MSKSINDMIGDIQREEDAKATRDPARVAELTEIFNELAPLVENNPNLELEASEAALDIRFFIDTPVQRGGGFLRPAKTEWEKGWLRTSTIFVEGENFKVIHRHVSEMHAHSPSSDNYRYVGTDRDKALKAALKPIVTDSAYKNRPS